MAVSSSIRHFKNVEHPLESIVRDPDWLDALFAEVPYGRYEPAKLLEHLRRGFPRTFGPKPIVFPGLIVVIPASDDLTEKTLKIGVVTV